MKNTNSQPLKLDVGCGDNKLDGYFGVDMEPLNGVDLVLDLEKEPLPFGDESVDEIYCSHFLEHVNNPIAIMREFHRVLKVNGLLTIIVPHYKNPHSYHFTHRTYWSSYSLEKRYIDYYVKVNFRPVEKYIRIISPLPVLNKPLNFLCNLNPSLYERVLSTFIQAWDIKFTLIKGCDEQHGR